MPDFTPLSSALDQLRVQIARVVVGRDEVVEQLLVTLLAGGHCLWEAPAGSARTWTAAALARTLGLAFARVSCTPDLTPDEVVASLQRLCDGDAKEQRRRGGLLLVDGIDRLAPRTRALFDDVMQDGEVRWAGRHIEMPQPLMVVAARYRCDAEQADVAAEPRCDRFFSKILLRYPSYHDEFRLADAQVSPAEVELDQVLDTDAILDWRIAVQAATAPDFVVHYALRLVRATRVHEGENPDFIFEWVATGAGPRAARHLLDAAKIRAALQRRERATVDDVKALAHCLLRHRLVVNQNAVDNGITPDKVIDRLLYEIPERIDGDDRPPTPGAAPDFDTASDAELL